MAKCVPCLQGLSEHCLGEDYCDKSEVSIPVDDSIDESETVEENQPRKPPRLRKNKATLKDPLSTGRKEAARLYPLDGAKDCEWAWLEKAGGGKYPVKGCGVRFGKANKQLNRHHGPDKNTLNNEEGNVHRICSHCHNMWHAANDDEYDPDSVDAGD